MEDQSFGKKKEQAFTSMRVHNHSVMIARLDGKGFSKFKKTAKLSLPFDKNFTKAMQECAKRLGVKFGADISFTQSDEITLVWFPRKSDGFEFPYGGKGQKLSSLLAAYQSVLWGLCFGNDSNKLTEEGFEAIVFDCRVYSVDTGAEAMEVLLERYDDCTKNAISMVAESVCREQKKSNKFLEKMSTRERLEFSGGREFVEDHYPHENLFGTLYVRQSVLIPANPAFPKSQDTIRKKLVITECCKNRTEFVQKLVEGFACVMG